LSHANARLTPASRLIMVQRISSGRAVAHVAAEMGISRTTAWRWWRRFREVGIVGLQDRSSVARSHPRRTGACQETRVRIMRELTRRGPVFIANRLGMQPSTVGRVLHRHRAPLLRELDPVTGTVVRASRLRLSPRGRARGTGRGVRCHGSSFGRSSSGRACRYGLIVATNRLLEFTIVRPGCIDQKLPSVWNIRSGQIE
jgi:transposase-like protein